MRVPKHTEALTLFDRIALAFGSIVFGVVTLFAYSVVVGFFVHPRAAVSVALLLASPIGIGYVAVCGLVGGIVSPARLAEFFSVLWGTHTFWESSRGRWVALAMAICLCVGLLSLR